MIEIVIKHEDGKYKVYEPTTSTLLISQSLGDAFINLSSFLWSEGFLSEDQNILNYPEISYHFDSETMQALIESNVKLLKRIQTAPSGFTISSQKFGGSVSTSTPKNKNKRDWKKKSAGFSKGGFISAQKKFG